jgi:hypothetical protein
MLPYAAEPALLLCDRHEEVVVRVLDGWLRSRPREVKDPGLAEALRQLQESLSERSEKSNQTPPLDEDRDPVLQAAYARGQALLVRRLEEEGGSLGADELGQQLGITPQAVHHRRREKRLVGYKLGREFHYPRWQLQPDGQPFPLIQELLQKFDATMLMAFLLDPHPALQQGQRPLDLLRAGEEGRLRELASAAGEQVSW